MYTYFLWVVFIYNITMEEINISTTEKKTVCTDIIGKIVKGITKS